jgi:hypothetical protein
MPILEMLDTRVVIGICLADNEIVEYSVRSPEGHMTYTAGALLQFSSCPA